MRNHRSHIPRDPRRTTRWRELRAEILHAAGYRCAKCGRTRPPSDLDVDHIVPLRDGGEAFARDNLQPLCKPCHWKKNASEYRCKTPGRDEWRDAVASMLNQT